MPQPLSTVLFPCIAAQRGLGWGAVGCAASTHQEARWGLVAPGFSQDNQKTSVRGGKKAAFEHADLCPLGPFDSAQDSKDTSSW